jgi:hypothetical protein
MRRIQNLVDREVQSSLAKRILLHWFALMFATALAILAWTRLIEAPTEPWESVLNISLGHLIPVVISFLVMLPMFIKDSLSLSNRFAGPIVRVKRALADFADGKSIEPVEFRHGDFWKSLAHEVNRVTSRSEKEAK